jgi:ABC-type multidrug transport system fused ATPase/permease subunit
VIAQTTILFNASVRQNLLLAKPGASLEAVEEAARRAQIHARILALPQGYDTVIGERGLKLSAGERQRLAIARTLLQDPPILILDEPTAALDGPTARALFSTLSEAVFPGRTVLLVTHQHLLAQRMDDLYELREKGLHKL